MIPSEIYTQLPEEVKTFIKLQRDYYREKAKAPKSPLRKPPQPQRHIKALNTITESGEGQDQFHDAVMPDTNTGDPNDEVVLDVVNQFLSRARNMNVCHTSRVFNIPARAIHANFSSKGNYG